MQKLPLIFIFACLFIYLVYAILSYTKNDFLSNDIDTSDLGKYNNKYFAYVRLHEPFK